MVAFQPLLERIHDLFHRLDRARDRNRPRHIPLNGQVKRLTDRLAHGMQLLRRGFRERQIALPEFLRAVKDILRVVPNLFEIGQRVHHLR